MSTTTTTQPTLTCGHEPTPDCWPFFGWTYAESGGKVCHACADEAERATMAGRREYIAHLSRDAAEITTLRGGRLARVTKITHGRETDDGRMAHVTAVTDDGRVWHGATTSRVLTIRARTEPVEV